MKKETLFKRTLRILRKLDYLGFSNLDEAYNSFMYEDWNVWDISSLSESDKLHLEIYHSTYHNTYVKILTNR
jgi:hypothetical protein